MILKCTPMKLIAPGKWERDGPDIPLHFDIKAKLPSAVDLAERYLSVIEAERILASRSGAEQ